MSLPNPLPDNPIRWDGWKHYNSDNYYERLCLEFDSNASAEQIEGNCRELLIWWQKKLPLKNQPSNPVAQMLRAGLDEAPVYLVEARTELLNPESRARIDAELHAHAVMQALEEFKKILSFALVDKKLTPEAEDRLYNLGSGLGLAREEIRGALDAELKRLGASRVAPAPKPAAVPVAAGAEAGPKDAFSEFRRMLRLSKLCLEGDEMTDDQRDALCNMGESLGLTGGQAEDLIDEYLDEVSGMPVQPLKPLAKPVAPKPAPPKPVAANGAATRPAPTPPPKAPAPAAAPVKTVITSPLVRAQEKHQYPPFINAIGAEMFLITSGTFTMGSDARDAAPNEQPLTPVTLSCFYMARHPITNAQYELFDPSHRARRALWADDRHPVVYVSSREAERFCQWLTMRDGHRYRLPTEAEWEFAARGSDGRMFPWGDFLDAGFYANFADRRTSFAWRDVTIDDGYAETSPIGAYPRSGSPFGIEDLSGNVFEWCLDFFEPYKGKECVNRRGPLQGTKRVYRGGSWKSRANSLRASARHFNSPDFSANDVGFRVVCDCES